MAFAGKYLYCTVGLAGAPLLLLFFWDKVLLVFSILLNKSEKIQGSW